MIIFFAKRIFFAMSFTIQNLDTREGIPGLVIGTLVGQQGDVFTPFFNYGGAIVLEENQLKLGPDYFFDFETKDIVSATFSINQDGIVNSFGYGNLNLSYNLLILFRSLDFG